MIFLNFLKINFLIVDLGFIIYWVVTYYSLIPDQFLYSDYHNPMLVVWNWSFFPIDILVSFTGITSLYLMNRKRQIWRYFAIISLTLTHASGLIAISFWTMQEWFDLSWWIPNLYLLLYPIPMIIYLLKEKDAA